MEKNNYDKTNNPLWKATSERSTHINIWMFLFFGLLVISIIIVAYQDMRRADEPLIYYKEKYDELERQYIELAKSFSYVLDVIMKNDINLQPYLTEFANKPREEYIEFLRRRIVAMQLDINRLEWHHRR